MFRKDGGLDRRHNSDWIWYIIKIPFYLIFHLYRIIFFVPLKFIFLYALDKYKKFKKKPNKEM